MIDSLNSEVESTVFTGSAWQVATADGTELKADFVMPPPACCTTPSCRTSRGSDSFEGDVVHTARWDQGIETSGRRIAVIGNGSTGVQIVSRCSPTPHISRI